MPQSSEPRWQYSLRTFFSVLFHSLPSLIVLNLVFLLSCLPVLTLGPALSALNRVTDELVRRRRPHPVRAYWTYFKTRFFVTLPWGLLFIILFLMITVAFLFYGFLSIQSLGFLPLGVITLVGLLALTGVGLHFFPALTRSDAPGRTLLRQAAGTAFMHLPGTLAAALLSLLLLISQLLSFPLTIPILLCLGGSAPSLIGSMARVEPVPEEC